MILVIADGSTAAARHEQALVQQGAIAISMTPLDFDAWLSTTSDADLAAIDAVLIGACQQAPAFVSALRRRTRAALIAIDLPPSLEHTLDALAAGFDDAIGRACYGREILARVAAIARRSGRENAQPNDRSAIEVFADGRAPRVGNAPLELPRREQQILSFLARRAGRRFTKDQIFLAVYGLMEVETNVQVIEFHICRLRKRLRDRLGYDPVDSRRHQGYLLNCRRATAASIRNRGAQ